MTREEAIAAAERCADNARTVLYGMTNPTADRAMDTAQAQAWATTAAVYTAIAVLREPKSSVAGGWPV